MTDYRQLPKVDPVAVPDRFRQSLLARQNVCMRSAYLQVKYPEQPGHHLDFGQAFHLFAEKAMLELMASDGEKSFYAPAEGEDPAAAARQVASMTAAMVDELLREHPELQVPVAHRSHSVDHLRQLAYHWAIAQDVDPQESVLGVERTFVLDLDCGVTVTGKVDVASVDGDTLLITDYKSGYMPSLEDDWAGTFQLKLYAVLLLYGQPVEYVPCSECKGSGYDPEDPPSGLDGCSWCDGKGNAENRLPCLGEGFNAVRSREVYPRHLRKDGSGLWERSVSLSRTEVQDFKQDVERLAERLADAFGSWEFPAVSGSHCAQCAAPAECPLPAVLRNHAGEINDLEQAAEAAEKLEREDAALKALKKELRRFAGRVGPIRFGRDRVWDFAEQESRSVDVEGMRQAAFEAAQYGTPFDPDDFISFKTSNRFGARTLRPDELGEEEPELSLDEKYGAEAPF